MNHLPTLLQPLRLVLAVAAFALGLREVFAGRAWGLGYFLLSGAVAYGYFRYSAVNHAFREVARGRMQTAARLLAGVGRPDRLSSTDRAYFELASGLVCASRTENERAERHLTEALSQQLRTDDDRALAEAVLSQLLLSRDAREEARAVITRAAARDCRPAIAQRIRAIRDELEQPRAAEPGSS